MHIVKLASYQGLGAISLAVWLNGVMIGPVMIVGSLVGKTILERLTTRLFMIIIEFAIISFGFWFLIK
ncbi:MAG: hypothetical protein ACXWTN_06095 [Methylosarcina sp.]